MRSKHFAVLAACVVPCLVYACGVSEGGGTIDADAGEGGPDGTTQNDGATSNSDGSSNGDGGVSSRDADAEAGPDLEIDSGPRDPALRIAPQAGLVAHYRGDGENGLRDGHNASIHGVTVGIDRFGSGGAGVFVGSASSYIEITGLTKLPVGAAARSVSVWVKTASPYAADPRGAVFSWGSSNPGSRFGLSVADGTDRFMGQSPTVAPNSLDMQGSINIADDRWHNVVSIFDGSRITTIVDKVQSATKPIALATSDQTLFIGKGPTATATPADEFFTGLIDDVRVYDRIVSPREVADLFHESGFPRAPRTDLRVHYRADTLDRGPFVQPAVTSHITLTTDRFGRPNQAGAYASAMQSYLEANHAALPIGNSARTISIWVKTSTPYAAPPRGGLAGWGTAAAGARFGLWVANGNAAFVGQSPDDGGANDLFGNKAIADNLWHDVVATYDGTQVVLYVDTVESARAPITLSTVGRILEVGRGATDSSPQEYIDATLDDVRVYGRVLTPLEIGDLFHDLAY